MLIRNLIFILFAVSSILISDNCHAQIDTILPAKVQPDNRTDLQKIDLLVEKHILINKTKKSVPGFRIQIYYGNKRAEALETKSKFQAEYDDLPAYLVYQQPNFKVRVGDFYTRMEALKHFQDISYDFGNAFIVKDEIKIKDLED